MNTASDTAGADAGKYGPYGYGPRFARDGDYMWWAKTPRFNVFKLLAVIAGFMIFPPLGIAALIYFLWIGKRMRHGGWDGHGGHRHGHGCGRHRMGRTGNVAFDEHRAKAMEDLEAERRAFEEFRAEQRRKHDNEAFEAFRTARKDGGDKPSNGE